MNTKLKWVNSHIERGLKAIEDKDFNDGIRLLRLGLIRSPGNLDGIVNIGTNL